MQLTNSSFKAQGKTEIITVSVTNWCQEITFEYHNQDKIQYAVLSDKSKIKSLIEELFDETDHMNVFKMIITLVDNEAFWQQPYLIQSQAIYNQSNTITTTSVQDYLN